MKQGELVIKDRNVEIYEKVNNINNLGNSIPVIIRKRPSKRQLRNYFLNMFRINIHGKDVIRRNIDNRVSSFVESVFSKYYKGVPFNKYENYSYKLISKISKLKNVQIRQILEDHDLMPEYLYGIRKDNKNFYMFDGFTSIEFASFEKDMFLFKCFNSEISMMYNSRYLEGIVPSIEVHFSNSGSVLYRELNNDFFIELDEDFTNIQFKRLIHIDKVEEVAGLNNVVNHPISQSFNVVELDIDCEIEDENAFLTILQMN